MTETPVPVNVPDLSETSVGEIGNYYGGLNIKAENGKPYWGIRDWDSEVGWEPCPLPVFLALRDIADPPTSSPKGT
jgi:hypothetical protein